MEYYYVACDGGLKVNESHRHYFRLYQTTDKGPILIEQGLKDIITSWESKYGATFSTIDPYPHLN